MEINADFILFMATFIVYWFMAIRTTKSTIKYFKAISFWDMRIAFVTASTCWWWYIIIYSLLLTGYVFGIETFINEENFRTFLRPMGLPLLLSMGYLINKIFP